MPSSFFDLPREIRDEIYGEFFCVEKVQQEIRPDPDGTRRSHGKGSNTLSLSKSLASFRTCRQANEEGTAVLYGKGCFYFDDEQHGNGLIADFAQELPPCDFVTMHRFLGIIGIENRQKIRHLQLLALYRPEVSI